MKKKDESSGRKNPIAVLPINVHITTPEMKSEGKQDFNQDLLVRWTEPTENKKSGNKKQEDDQETAERPKQDQTDSKDHRLSKT